MLPTYKFWATKRGENPLKHLGDRERDAGNWLEAAAAYREYLQAKPGDFAILVQLGNCLKEAGDFGAAEGVYDAALKLNDADFDLHLQRGHLYKLQGRGRAASEAYQLSVSLNAESAARRELLRLGQFEGGEDPAVLAPKEATVYLDVTDAICFLRENMRFSGIQRVIASIFESLRHNPELFPCDYRCCMLDVETGLIYDVPNGVLARLVELVKSPETTREILDGALARCRNRDPIATARGDVYVIMGAFWISPFYLPALMDMRARGVTTVVCIQDLIPIVYRQEVDQHTAEDFTTRFLQIASLSDVAWTSSEYVATQIRSVVKEELGREMPVIAMGLGQELLKSKGTHRVRAELEEIASKGFVLCVGTIEARKNHRYLFDIWRELITERGDSVPTLVFLGKWGWRVESLRNILEDSDYLANKIVILSGISDYELSYLYDKCLFTVFPSLVEGWGLPVGESLAHGKLCISSMTSSLPEVGGDFAIYIDPTNISDGMSKIAWAFDNPKEIEELNVHIRNEFQPLTWEMVTARYGEAIKSLPQKTMQCASDYFCSLPLAEIVPLGANEISSLSRFKPSATTYPLICVSGWDFKEPSLIWSHNSTCILRFGLRGEVSGVRTLRCALRLQLPKTENYARISTRSAQTTSDFVLLDGVPRWSFFTICSDASGVFEVTLSITKSNIVQLDTHHLQYLGLSAIALCDEEVTDQRLRLIEQIVSYTGLCITK